VLRDAADHRVVAHRLGVELTGALGLWNRLELYGRLPATWHSVGQDADYEQTHFKAPGGTALGDMALGGTALLWSGAGVELGGRAELILPTGNRGQLAGDSALAPRLHGLASYRHRQLLLAANAGYVYRPDRAYAVARIGSELEWSSALRFDAPADYQISLEAFGTLGLRERSGAGASDSLDVLIGGKKALDTGAVRMRLGAAVGGGFSQAYGDPRLRAMLSVSVESRPGLAPTEVIPSDEDRDRIGADRDECPDVPEDRDGFDDEDGCPEEDNDGDGVLDALDACPLIAASNALGCPEPDADADAIPDERDRCPQDAEDDDGDRDTDGCPERDRDGDGLSDDLDACPDVPGLPEVQGCRLHARLAGERMALSAELRFDGEVLVAGQEPVLDDVAAVLQARSRLQAVVDVTAPNTTLALARANALISALVARGVEPERLTPEGNAGSPERLEIRLRGAKD
jgi:hypothetical protein